MKRLILLFLIIFVALQVYATGTAETSKNASKQSIKLTFAHVFTTDSPVHKGALYANNLLKKKTNGRISLQIYPNGSFAGYKDAVRAVRMGTLDIAPLDSAIDWYPASGVLLGPYTFRSYDHWKKFKKSDVAKEMLKNISDKVGVKALGFYMFGFRNLTTKNLVVRTPADLKNFKLRVVDFPPYPEAATVLGAVATPLPIGDVYMALKTGVVDGEENPFTQILTMKFYEVQKYVILTEHMLATTGFVMSKKAWSKLDSQDQKIVSEVFSSAADYIDDLVIKNNNAMMKDLESKGMTIVKIDKKPFMARVPLVLKKYPQWVPLYNKIQAIK